jgi:hypothetical protein
MGSVCELHARIQHHHHQQQIVGRSSHHSERRMATMQAIIIKPCFNTGIHNTHQQHGLHVIAPWQHTGSELDKKQKTVCHGHRASRFMSYAQDELHAPAGALYPMFTNDRCITVTLAAQVLLWRQTAPRAAR